MMRYCSVLAWARFAGSVPFRLTRLRFCVRKRPRKCTHEPAAVQKDNMRMKLLQGLPVRELLRMMRYCSVLAFARFAGSVPFRLFWLKSSVCRVFALPSVLGTGPVNELPHARNVCAAGTH